jgi:hypothetical protein
LRDIGTGRFAAIVEDRFYVLDTGSQSARPVDSLGLFAEVAARSGNSLLVRTRGGDVLFGADRDVVTRLGEYRMALPARTRDRWWLVDHDGMLRDSAFGRVRPIPDRVRLIGEFANGFLILDDNGYAWWDGTTDTTRPLVIDGTLLAVSDTAIVSRSACSTTSCTIGIHDAARRMTRQFSVPAIMQAAEVSADGSLFALMSTRADIAVVDAQGNPLWVNRGRGVAPSTPPLSWTTNSNELLVVEENGLVIWRGPDTALRTIVGVPGLTQIVALP